MPDLLVLSRPLLALGFAMKTQSPHVALYRDVSKALRQEIYLTDSSKFRWLGSELRISIRMPDFDRHDGDETEHYEIVEVLLTPDGCKYHGESMQPNWPYSRERDFVSALMEEGIKWLEKFSNVDFLVSFLVEGLKSGIPCSPPRGSMRDNIISRMFLRQNRVRFHPGEVRRLPKFKQGLADLFFWEGDLKNAARYMREWIEFNKQRPMLVKRYIEKLAEIEESINQ